MVTVSKEKSPSLLRQVAPAAILTATGVAFVSLLDNPSGAGNVSLNEGAVGATTTVPNDGAVTTEPTVNQPAPDVTTTLAPSPATSVVGGSVSAQGSGGAAATPESTTTTVVVPAETAAPAATATTPAAATGGACDGDVVTSPTAMFRWGGIQLQVSFTKANAICDVTVLQYPNDRGKSIYINQNALPTYNKEAVAANSATISAVSGATESWQAYTAALQAVLDSRK